MSFKCGIHSTFFKIDCFQLNTSTEHHWSTNLPQPSKDIDLASRRDDTGEKPSNKRKASTGQEEYKENLPSVKKTKFLVQKLVSSVSQAFQVRNNKETESFLLT